MAQVLVERIRGVEVALSNVADDIIDVKETQKEILNDVKMLLIHKATRDGEVKAFKRMTIALATIVSGAVNVALLFIEAWYRGKA